MAGNLGLKELKGMTDDVAKKLRGAGITNSDLLLEKAGPAAGRRALAKELDLDAKMLLELVNRADLARIQGIGEQYSNLLEEAGVDTVKELATRRADNLHTKLTEVAAAGHVKRAPRMDEVESWVKQAKEMPGGVTH